MHKPKTSKTLQNIMKSHGMTPKSKGIKIEKIKEKVVSKIK